MKKLHNLLPNPAHQLILLVLVMLLMNCVMSIFADPPATQPPRPVYTTGANTESGTVSVTGSVGPSGSGTVNANALGGIPSGSYVALNASGTMPALDISQMFRNWSPGSPLPSGSNTIANYMLVNMWRSRGTFNVPINHEGTDQNAGTYSTTAGFDSVVTSGTISGAYIGAYWRFPVIAKPPGMIDSTGGSWDWRQIIFVTHKFKFTTDFVATGSYSMSWCSTGGTAQIASNQAGIAYLLKPQTTGTAAVMMQVSTGTTLTTTGTLASIAIGTTQVVHEIDMISTGTWGGGVVYLYVDGVPITSTTGGPQTTAGIQYFHSMLYTGTTSGTAEGLVESPPLFNQIYP